MAMRRSYSTSIDHREKIGHLREVICTSRLFQNLDTEHDFVAQMTSLVLCEADQQSEFYDCRANGRQCSHILVRFLVSEVYKLASALKVKLTIAKCGFLFFLYTDNNKRSNPLTMPGIQSSNAVSPSAPITILTVAGCLEVAITSGAMLAVSEETQRIHKDTIKDSTASLQLLYADKVV